MNRRFDTVLEVMEWKKEELAKIKETTVDGYEIMKKLKELEKEYDVYFEEAMEAQTQKLLQKIHGMVK